MRVGQTLAGLLNATLVRLITPLNAETCLLMTSFRVMRKWLVFLRYLCADVACCSSVELIVAVSGALTSRPSFWHSMTSTDYRTCQMRVDRCAILS